MRLNSLILCLSHLLIEHLFLLIPHLHEFSDLPVNQLLLRGLFGGEPLLRLGLFEVLQGLSLLLILNDLVFFLLLLDGDLLLNLNKLLIGLFELSPGPGHLLLLLQIPHLLSLDLLFYLFFDELTLQFLLLHLLDIVDVEIVELLVDLLLVFESLLVGPKDLLLNFPVVFLHLLFF